MRDSTPSNHAMSLITVCRERSACVLVALSALQACAPLNTDPMNYPPVLEVRSGRWVSREDLVRALVTADYVLLGETHDNREHHRGQLELFAALAGTRPPPALAMEQFDLRDQGPIDRVRASGGDADALAAATDMGRKKWDWPSYRPLVALALEWSLPIVAANIPRQELFRVASRGFGELPDARRFALEATWNPARESALRAVIFEAHCGNVPDDLMPALVISQRARDAVMADAMLANPRSVLIAGRGHARADHGVPIYLHARAPHAKIVSVAFVEYPEGGRASDAEVLGKVDERAAYDYIWPTAPAKRPDPCAGFSMQRPSREGPEDTIAAPR